MTTKKNTKHKSKAKNSRQPKTSSRIRFIFSIILNLFVIIAALAAVVSTIFFSQPTPSGIDARGLNAFRFFTIDSNLLAAICCACVLPYAFRKIALPRWVSVLKFTGTVSVAITFCTVMFFLGPTIGYDKMFVNENLFLHLLCPLACLVSLLFCDRLSKFNFAMSLLSLIPVIIYAVVYLLMVMVFQAWPDFYGFNATGHWYISMAAMGLGALAISSLLWFIISRRFRSAKH